MARSDEALDRTTELLGLGAGHAAAAFAALLGGEFAASAPRVAHASAADPDEGAPGAVSFEVEGALSGVVALLLPASSRRLLLRRLLGDGAVADDPALVRSAIQELGNIVVSRVCSAIADEVGAKLVPSVPALELEDGEAALAACVARRGGGGLRIEAEIADPSGRLHARLVFCPDAAGKRTR